MLDKIVEDIYSSVKGHKYGKPLIVVSVVFVCAFFVWQSIPEKAKEALLGFGSPPTPSEEIKPAREVPVVEREPSAKETPSRVTTVKPPLPVSDQIEPYNVSGDPILGIYAVPDLGGAKEHLGLKTTDFTVDGENKLDTEGAPIDGYFNVNIKPREGAYSGASVQYQKEFSPHFYMSARLAGDNNVDTLEIQGLGIHFLIDNHRNSYYLWASEQNEQKWRPLPIEKDAAINTLGIFQHGRYAVFFLNNKKVDSFDILATPKPGKVGLYFKAQSATGGRAHFQRFSVYEF